MCFFLILDSRGTPNLIIHRVAGGELFAYVAEREKLDEEEASGYLRQIIDGVSYMHSQNIVHLDIKVWKIGFNFKIMN